MNEQVQPVLMLLNKRWSVESVRDRSLAMKLEVYQFVNNVLTLNLKKINYEPIDELYLS